MSRKKPYIIVKHKPGRPYVPPYMCKMFGCARVLGLIPNSVILIHSPVGCLSHARTDHICISRAVHARMITTGLRDEDVIFGGEEKLKKAIIDAYKKYKPELLSVITGCVPDLIGEDFEEVIRSVRDQIDCELIALKSGGYTAKYDLGYEEAFKAVVYQLMEEQPETEERTVNILGELRPKGSDRYELIRLLNKIGIKHKCVLMGDSTANDLKKAPAAELNVLKCYATGYHPARYMEERFGTPYIIEPPAIGIKWTNSWLLNAAEYFGLESEAEKVIEEESKKVQPIYEKARKVLKGKKCAILAGPDRFVGLVAFALELGMEPTCSLTHTETKHSIELMDRVLEGSEVTPKLLVGLGFDEFFEEISETRPDLVFADDESKGFCYQLGIPCVGIMSYEMPHMGYRGAIKLTEYVLNEYQNPIFRYAYEHR